MLRSVYKNRSDFSPGAATPKAPNVTIILTDDLVSTPDRNAGGVLMEGNFVFKPGTGPLQCYMTASKQAPSFEGEGEEDSISVKHKFDGMHPGDALEINELVQGLMGQNVIIIYGSCSNTIKKVYGTPCAPLQLKPSFVANNDMTGHTLVFEAFQKTKYLPGHYLGELPTGNPTAVVGAAVELSVADGFQYKLAPFASTASITAENTDLPAGTFVTLIGGGGANPATLATGAGSGDNADVLLRGGANWIALDGATIDLEVFDDGTTTHLIERKRS